LNDRNIAYEIVPGITAASGASAYAGIPLTARGYATSVRFLTNYTKTVVSESYWEELAHSSDTLVFYMSSNTLDHLVERLKRNGVSDDQLIAVVSQASTPFQQVAISSLQIMMIG